MVKVPECESGDFGSIPNSHNMIIKMFHYTVIMLRADGLCSPYQTRVLAQTSKSAVIEAWKKLAEADKSSIEESKKAFIIAVYAGWHDDITPTMINGEPA